MNKSADFADSLRVIAAKIEKWREDARRIRAQTDEALDTKSVRADRLLEIEETAGEIYREIASFDEQAEHSTATAAERAEVDDALRLVLMEITELSTAMYSVRSMEPPDPQDQPEQQGSTRP
jgi:erythromycin esterase-like protein